MPKRRAERYPRESKGGKRVSLFLFGLAGLGVGIWLFRSRRRRRQGS